MTPTEPTASMDRHAAAAKLISTAVRRSAAAAIIPVPYVDLVAIGAVQVHMVRNLAQIYGIDAENETLKIAISALLGTLAPAVISGGLFGSALKLVPLGGTVLGSVSLAAFGSAATYAVGKVFVAHFDKGGTLSSFSAEAVEADLKKEFMAAKAKV